mmetsp:Transcript_7864/g.12120  ORF Transcript_7864/g.12120 Transcript_7864/m.12120 type:complete len:1142 (+) Transcript_7864:80-3505(+)
MSGNKGTEAGPSSGLTGRGFGSFGFGKLGESLRQQAEDFGVKAKEAAVAATNAAPSSMKTDGDGVDSSKERAASSVSPTSPPSNSIRSAQNCTRDELVDLLSKLNKKVKLLTALKSQLTERAENSEKNLERITGFVKHEILQGAGSLGDEIDEISAIQSAWRYIDEQRSLTLQQLQNEYKVIALQSQDELNQAKQHSKKLEEELRHMKNHLRGDNINAFPSGVEECLDFTLAGLHPDRRKENSNTLCDSLGLHHTQPVAVPTKDEISVTAESVEEKYKLKIHAMVIQSQQAVDFYHESTDALRQQLDAINHEVNNLQIHPPDNQERIDFSTGRTSGLRSKRNLHNKYKDITKWFIVRHASIKRAVELNASAPEGNISTAETSISEKKESVLSVAPCNSFRGGAGASIRQTIGFCADTDLGRSSLLDEFIHVHHMYTLLLEDFYKHCPGKLACDVAGLQNGSLRKERSAKIKKAQQIHSRIGGLRKLKAHAQKVGSHSRRLLEGKPMHISSLRSIKQSFSSLLEKHDHTLEETTTDKDKQINELLNKMHSENDLASTITALDAQLFEARDKVTSLESRLSEAMSTNTQLRSQYEKLRNALTEFRARSGDVVAGVKTDLELTLREKESALEVSEELRLEISNAVIRHRKELSSIKEEHSLQLARVTRQCSESKSQNAKLSTKLSETMSTYERLRAEYDKLKNLYSESQGRNGETIICLRSELQAAIKCQEEERKEAGRRKDEVERIKSLHREKLQQTEIHFKEQLSATQHELKIVTSTKSQDLKEAKKSIEQWHETAVEAADKLVEAERLLKGRDEELFQVREQVGKSKQTEAEVSSLRRQINELKLEQATSSALLTRLQAEKEDSERKHGQRTALVGMLETQLAELNDSNNETKAKLEGALYDIHQKNEVIEGLEEQVRTLEEMQEKEKLERKAAAEVQVTTSGDVKKSRMLEALQREVHGLQQQMGKKSAAAQRLLQEREAECHKLRKANHSLQQEVDKGTLSDRRIFELAARQSTRDTAATTEIEIRNRLVEVLTDRLLKRDGDLAAAEFNVHQVEGQVEELVRVRKREDVNIDYLKSIVVQYLSKPPGSSERTALLPVLATLLQFDENDYKAIEEGKKKNKLVGKCLSNTHCTTISKLG